MTLSDRIIVALDVDSRDEVRGLLSELQGCLKTVKVGPTLFYSEGPSILDFLHEQGLDVFLDMKIHDVPNVGAKAVLGLARPGVRMLSLHASGGLEMMRAARETLQGIQESDRPRLLGVTELANISQDVLNQELRISGDLQERVFHLAHMTKHAGLDGIVCSPREVKAVRARFGRPFFILCPGVREAIDRSDSSLASFATPHEAWRDGADYIIVGREITHASQPRRVFESMLSQMERA